QRFLVLELPVCRPQFTLGFRLLPRLVFIKITPLAPRDPYTAVAFASFNTVIDSMSFALMSDKGLTSCPPKFRPWRLSLLIITSSTTYSGSLPPEIELVPLRRTNT